MGSGDVIPTGLETLETVLSAIWTAIVGNGSTTSGLVGTIANNPLLLILVAASFASLVIGLTQKLMGIRRRKG